LGDSFSAMPGPTDCERAEHTQVEDEEMWFDSISVLELYSVY